MRIPARQEDPSPTPSDTADRPVEGAQPDGAPEMAASAKVVAPEVTGGPVAVPRKRDKHLYQLDLFRLITFGSVILDHVIMGIAAPNDAISGAFETLTRYSRFGFFFLTGFVLGYQYRSRELKPVVFWRRRFKLIGIPYVTWSLFYWVYNRYRAGGSDAVKGAFDNVDHVLLSLKSMAYDLVTGNAMYHLYFLFVSMQIYLVFPLVLWVLKRTWGYHRYLLAVSFALHMMVLYLMVRPQTGFLADGFPGVVWSHVVITLFPYQFYVLAGCIAALHFDAFHAASVRWRAAIFGGGVAVIAATLVYYAYKVHEGEDLFRATNVFMPHNAFGYIAIIAGLYGIGSVWRERRRPGSLADKLLKTAADRSFGIYLAHALALGELRPLVVDAASDGDPTWWVSLWSFVGTVVLTVLIVEALRHSPLSLMTTGRAMVSWKDQQAVRWAAYGVAAVVVGLVLRAGFGILAGDVTAISGLLMIASAALVAARQWDAARHRTGSSVAEVDAQPSDGGLGKKNATRR
ncbi:acyltransferase [Williamsia sterculiae]|uniref:Surface polysaccharide O-acyltransferase, integral membrane enzyme n=1 Tax=Williamsia sterculiae TaxID=1344003 RepID=A0A1N7EYI9_9NOCA|nr:acyltransferase [Williamsia sterculiae]SIR93158.1 Surface polysaccharide O-acyltransferase, integral membrane enzyme [Williamsia sterculiae]